MMTKPFSIGDVVELNSGSPKLTICTIQNPGEIDKETLQVIIYDPKEVNFKFVWLPSKVVKYVAIIPEI